LFRLALEKGAPGKTWHAVGDEGIPFREIAEAVAKRIGLPATSIPADEMMVPGILQRLVGSGHRRLRGVERHHSPGARLGTCPSGLFEDMDNGHYFPAA